MEQTTRTEDVARRERKAKRLAEKLFFKLGPPWRSPIFTSPHRRSVRHRPSREPQLGRGRTGT